jgi:Uma2 family endonuclease
LPWLHHPNTFRQLDSRLHRQTPNFYNQSNSPMHPLQAWPTFTPEEYLEREQHTEERSEYHRGLILAMAGTSENHAFINFVTAKLLDRALPVNSCRITTSEIKVAAPNQTSFFYPDILIRCNQSIAGHKTVTETPNAVVEILSPSTRAYDLSTKREVYQSIPSLHTLLYIDSTKRQVLLYERDSKGKWPKNPSRPTKTLTLKHLNIAIPIDAFYENTDFA